MSLENRLSTNEDDHETSQSATVGSNSGFSEFHTVGERVCQILMPVTLCSLYVVLLVKLGEMNVTKSDSIMARALSRLGLLTSTKDHHALGKAMLGSLYLVLCFLALIVVVTLIVLFVLYMEWHSCLNYYFHIPSLLIMAIISPGYFRVVGKSLNCFSLDLITLAIMTWNFTALGMMAIFSLYASTPLILQQLYLIHNSSVVAVLIVNILPGWAPWMLLGLLVVWDLFAAMAPFGPLNLIVSMAEKMGIVDMPGLVYSTDVHPNDPNSSHDAYNQSASEQPNSTTRKSVDSANERGNSASLRERVAERRNFNLVKTSAEVPEEVSIERSPSPRENRTTEKRMERKSIEERGINIGLGDFIFYGLLIGVTAKEQDPSDYYTILATFNSILVGLVATLAILAITRRMLPALPISISLGLIMTGLSTQFSSNFANKLASDQIFI